MPKKKSTQKSTSKKKSPQKEKINYELVFEPKKKQRVILYILIVIVSFSLSYYYINYALSQNSTNGFPIDDPWIHLTFAKNLVEYQSFSYFKDDMATSGSTSPIYSPST